MTQRTGFCLSLALSAFVPLVLAPLALVPLAIPSPARASDEKAHSIMIQPAGDMDLSDFKWSKRPILVFADSPEDPYFADQIDKLTEGLNVLADRDVVILTDTRPETLSPLRRKFRPKGFMLVLVGKDGGVKLRKPLPWTVREITRSIDKMPMRQREIRERRGEG